MKATRKFAHGFTMLEVLITLVILAFGVLGLANLQAKMHVVEMESYQRSQAVLLLDNMVSRINANRANAGSYVTTAATPAYLGIGDAQPTSCTALTGAPRDRCEWSNSLKGAAEVMPDGPDADSLPDQVGGMIGARGCVEQLQAAVGTPTCTPGAYRVTVVWQGLNATAAPTLLCAQSINAYGGDSLRRAIAARITIGLPGCTP